ncbi:MAG TPA: hypothetical protein VJY12_10730 [Dysgonamonadaceae bacterium]|jgi:oxaloacetate decarboxylase gamma subunit|nr:hypothetical protein [Dysgonamonadaceae bacterium]
MENINEALGLLAVGMIMVFIILFLVTIIGNVVIHLTNRYIPVVEKPNDGTKSTNSKKLAVIAAVVDLVTQGEGRVDSIQKK